MKSGLLELPARPLALKGRLLSIPKTQPLVLFCLLAFGIFLFIQESPGLLRDLRINADPVIIDAQVSDGHCTTYRAIFTNCEGHVSYSYLGQNYSSDVDFMFVDLHIGDYKTDVIISNSHPELATLSLALEKLWNRLLTLGGFGLVILLLSINLIFQQIRALRVQAALRTPALLREIPVAITRFTQKKDGLFITYMDKLAEDKTNRLAHTRLDPSQLPLIIGEHKGQPVALAVRHGGSALPVLLDHQLQRIEMTEGERQQALLALKRHNGDAGLAAARTLSAGPNRSPMAQLMLFTTIFGGTLLVISAGIFGFWLWYVTTSPTAFQSPGTTINNMMPAGLNRWGCAQLKARFGHDRAPYGCTAADYQSWK